MEFAVIALPCLVALLVLIGVPEPSNPWFKVLLHVAFVVLVLVIMEPSNPFSEFLYHVAVMVLGWIMGLFDTTVGFTIFYG